MRKATSGFTIVELLIVIVVIAIIATISVVAYSGAQRRASQTAILSEVNQWKKLFEAYKAANGSYPSPVASGDPTTSGGPGSMAPNVYCLGTGFPESSGQRYCYSASSTSNYRAHESTGTYLLSQLSTVATPPKNTRKYSYGIVVGPFLRYATATSAQIMTIFPPDTDCSSMSMLESYGDSSRQDCYYILDYSN